MNYTLSKTRYCRGFQCPKMLWMDFHMPEKAEKVTNDAVLVNGHLVGDLAREYFGSFELVPFDFNKKVLAYCRLDTLAMVKVLEKMRERVGEP